MLCDREENADAISGTASAYIWCFWLVVCLLRLAGLVIRGKFSVANCFGFDSPFD